MGIVQFISNAANEVYNNKLMEQVFHAQSFVQKLGEEQASILGRTFLMNYSYIKT